MFLCISFFQGLRIIHVGIPASSTSRQQTSTTRGPPPDIYWMASPPASSAGAPRHTAAIQHASAVNMYVWLLQPGRIVGFVNQMAANSDNINTGCKTEEGSVVQAGFAWSTLLSVAVQMDFLT